MSAPATTLAAPDARALPNQWEDEFLDGEIDAEDFVANTLARPRGFGRATPAYVGIEAYRIDRIATSSEFGALVVLELPLERFARSAAPLASGTWLSALGAPPPLLAPGASLLEAPALTALPPLLDDSVLSPLSQRDSSGFASPPSSPPFPGSLTQAAPLRTDPTARPGEPSARAEPAVRADPAARAEPAVRGEQPRSPMPLAVSTNVARACIRAALRMVGLSDDHRLDSVAARSRSSAVLPELRLRALRTMGESGRVSLSEDDPSRYVASGAATNVLEARLTFRLDRLLFADEELAVERVRIDRSELRSRITAKALAALFEWQRAYCLANDPGLASDDHRTAVLRELEACAILDAMTGGWFGGYRAELPSPAR
jgi:hypothetical protein